MTDRSRSPYRSPRRGQRRPAATPPAPKDPARRVAYDVLRAVETRDAYANLLLPAQLRERGVTGRDAALATELTYGTLRRQGTYDAILDACVDRSLRSVDAEVLPVLRLGAHQLLSTKIPPHAAVSATVDLARRVVGQHRARFANAVLRRVSARDMEEWLAIVAPAAESDRIGHLAVVHSHPRWMVEALAAALGERPGSELADTERLLAAHNDRPRVTLVAKPGRAAVADLVSEGAVEARYSPYAAYLPEGDPAALRPVRQGRAAVQDEASQLVALALTRVPVEGADATWLDMCAGPGGKAGLLAGLAGGREAHLLAAEVQPSRAGLVAGAVRRSVRDAARVVVADSTRPAWREAAFDRVLVDAPCTGLGALRRRPESRWRRTPETAEGLAPLQRALLDRALDSTRPGGVVAYVTCSPHLPETRGIVDAVRAQRPDVAVIRAADHLPEVADVAVDDGDYVQFWPHRHGTDAMFLALLRRL
ncbi:RsmB/NOP family class I SAM-dependent RNA methyltransferase [Marinitenerispora sediminis]|uniref:rRNA cytosine-C5-methyltransferase n=1 Tax=Marinitenerispora sediminis TaxID=1931232 RepID=A0A368T1Z4_9ACTN|nr:transcription antitermination factor NusB [Marinitenerispora sediminis]RCV49436.1 rRNA cytosine-C5-methyltransferase [Marinitenerispora sediminis]RCV56675.1 rRNA cytosine-C5-methyltransferase [Marinitenerispora sediminis]RCV61667.1 rRNA cytosine-C5-methyltransferase [Marinitenerispora sediminis]